MLYEKLKEFFDSGWLMSTNDEEEFLRLIYTSTKGLTWSCYAQAADEDRVFIFYSVWPENVDEAMRPAMADLLTRINYGIKIGNFEMDFNDGEIRYKSSVFVEDGIWRDELIRPNVFMNIGMFSQYAPALQALQAGTCGPEEAAAMVE